MASHSASWVSGTHVRFESLGFSIITKGGLERARAPAPPPYSPDHDTFVETLEELQLHAPEVHASEGDQLLAFNYERLDRQLSVFLGPKES
jgi:hypothetical protein